MTYINVDPIAMEILLSDVKCRLHQITDVELVKLRDWIIRIEEQCLEAEGHLKVLVSKINELNKDDNPEADKWQA